MCLHIYAIDIEIAIKVVYINDMLSITLHSEYTRAYLAAAATLNLKLNFLYSQSIVEAVSS